MAGLPDPILASGDFDAVRKMLDPFGSIGSAELPDATLAGPGYLGVTQGWVAMRLGHPADVPADLAARTKVAAQSYLASLVAPLILQLVSHTVGDGTREYAKRDLDILAARLRTTAEEQVSSVGSTLQKMRDEQVRPFLFGRAVGRRGR